MRIAKRADIWGILVKQGQYIENNRYLKGIERGLCDCQVNKIIQKDKRWSNVYFYHK